MDAILIGGPRHGDVDQVDDSDGILPNEVHFALAKDDQQAKEWVGLWRFGIEPPIGAVVLHYVALRFVELHEPLINPAVYVFVGMEGDPEEIQTED